MCLTTNAWDLCIAYYRRRGKRTGHLELAHTLIGRHSGEPDRVCDLCERHHILSVGHLAIPSIRLGHEHQLFARIYTCHAAVFGCDVEGMAVVAP